MCDAHSVCRAKELTLKAAPRRQSHHADPRLHTDLELSLRFFRARREQWSRLAPSKRTAQTINNALVDQFVSCGRNR